MEFERVDEFLACLQAALNTKAENAAEPVSEILGSHGVVGVIRQARISYPADELMLLQKPRDFQCALGVALLAQRQRLQALQEQKGIERTHAGTDIAQQLNTRLDDKRDITQSGEVSECVP